MTAVVTVLILAALAAVLWLHVTASIRRARAEMVDDPADRDVFTQ